MAPGVGRLGTFLTATLVDVLRVLDATPAPRGGELAAAVALREWCVSQWPDIAWTVQRYAHGGANLVASCSPGPLLYSHLDTSLDGSSADVAVTGRDDDAGAIRVVGGRVEGFGLGVARAPAAAALLGFVAARRGTLLLAGSGTHRRGSNGAGVERYLEQAAVPGAAVVAKCGPPSVLWEEPGAMYLRARVAGQHGAVLAYDSAVPAGGVVAQAGVVLEAVARWREEYLRSRPAVGQCGAAAGVGAIRAGRPGKPDLFAAALELDLYVVTLPGEDPSIVAGELAEQIRAACSRNALASCNVLVDAELVHPAAATAADAPIVHAARAAWLAEFGSPAPPVSGWTGSTDGVVLRAHGIDTVRLGPQSARSADDPRRDVLELSQLDAYVRLYAALLG